MRGALFLLTASLLVQGSAAAASHGALATAAMQQKDRLEGRWSGSAEGPVGGKQDAFVTFKKEGDGYSGKISGLRPGMEAALKDVKLDGDKLTARTDFETPQGSLTVNYSFTLAGETLKGKGETEFGGQTYAFDFDLKRTSTDPAAAPPASAASAAPPPRREVPQPQQKQSIDYFVGQWNFNWIGRESALGPAPREGTATFTRRADGKTLDVRIEGRADGKPFSETAVLAYDDQNKALTFTERRSNGVQIQSKGDWRSPISIRFTVDPIKVKGQTLMLKRTISVVAAHSFTITEELAEDGGPFVRLGNAVYSKVEGK
jgi:hypothetical protein